MLIFTLNRKRQARKQTKAVYKKNKEMYFFGSSIQFKVQTYNGCLLDGEMSPVHRVAPLWKNSRCLIVLALLFSVQRREG